MNKILTGGGATANDTLDIVVLDKLIDDVAVHLRTAGTTF